jgi:hypothetical protein
LRVSRAGRDAAVEHAFRAVAVDGCCTIECSLPIREGSFQIVSQSR